MKIYLPNNSEQSIGGGWTFLRNFKKGCEGKAEIVDTVEAADCVLIPGVTMANTSDIEAARWAKKPIIFRVDNIPKKSRNKRSRVYDNMKHYAEIADFVVYQSEWAKHYAYPLCGDGEVIYNGVDTTIFNPKNRTSYEYKRYLYSQFNRDENKRFPEAAYYFNQKHRSEKNSELTLVGQFSPELVDSGFDFFEGEDVEYLGVVTDPKLMAEIYKSHDYLLFPAFADAAPNTVLEARACGMVVLLANPTGGTREMLEVEDLSLERMVSEYLALFNLALSGDREVSM